MTNASTPSPGRQREHASPVKRGVAALPEPWLRGTLTDIPAVLRAVFHALQLAHEDALRWCQDLSESEMRARPCGLPSLAFQLRHMTGSLDRLLTYAEGQALTEQQLEAAHAEDRPDGDAHLLVQFAQAVAESGVRLAALSGEDLEAARFVGRRRLPTTLGGLVVHIADHTQRHCGQLVSTARVVLAARP